MPSGEASVAEERVKEWLQCVEVGGKKLVQSLQDSHLQELDFSIYHTTPLYFIKHHQLRQLQQSIQALMVTVATVNTARSQKGLPIICTVFYSR